MEQEKFPQQLFPLRLVRALIHHYKLESSVLGQEQVWKPGDDTEPEKESAAVRAGWALGLLPIERIPLGN